MKRDLDLLRVILLRIEEAKTVIFMIWTIRKSSVFTSVCSFITSLCSALAKAQLGI